MDAPGAFCRIIIQGIERTAISLANRDGERLAFELTALEIDFDLKRSQDKKEGCGWR